jgi:hypothetical protein
MDALELVVWHRGPEPTVRIVPASRWRDWMNATEQRVANRCLPLLMANQSGWVMLNPVPFTVKWDGRDAQAALTFEYPEGTPDERQIAISHFGYGIVTFRFQDMIQTSPGYNLMVRGPTNSPKDGVAALDGMVETDWSAAPFTMNWKLTRPGEVRFEQDEPFCHIFPVRRGELERFAPESRRLETDPELAKRVEAWGAKRAMVILATRLNREGGDESWRRYWMDDYFKGRSPTGQSSPEHQTTLRLRPLGENAPAELPDPAASD